MGLMWLKSGFIVVLVGKVLCEFTQVMITVA